MAVLIRLCFSKWQASLATSKKKRFSPQLLEMADGKNPMIRVCAATEPRGTLLRDCHCNMYFIFMDQINLLFV